MKPVPVGQTRRLRQAVLRPHLTVEEMTGSEPPDAFGAGAFEDDELIAVGLIGPEGGAREVWASVRTPARALYERAGFYVDSDMYEVPHLGPHVVMRLRES